MPSKIGSQINLRTRECWSCLKVKSKAEWIERRTDKLKNTLGRVKQSTPMQYPKNGCFLWGKQTIIWEENKVKWEVIHWKQRGEWQPADDEKAVPNSKIGVHGPNGHWILVII